MTSFLIKSVEVLCQNVQGLVCLSQNTNIVNSGEGGGSAKCRHLVGVGDD